jgi:antitoxin component HigA of HigAB toxin-antitoxin module
MPVVVKTHPINIRFKSRTPLRVIQSVKKQFSNYIIDDKDESVDWFETDLHKEIASTMTPAKTLRALREMTGWTLAETGKKIGVSPYRVSDYETGQRAISKEMAKKLAEAFETSPAEFI